MADCRSAWFQSKYFGESSFSLESCAQSSISFSHLVPFRSSSMRLNQELRACVAFRPTSSLSLNGIQNGIYFGSLLLKGTPCLKSLFTKVRFSASYSQESDKFTRKLPWRIKSVSLEASMRKSPCLHSFQFQPS